MDLASCTREDFEPLVSSAFSLLRDGEQAVPLTLTSTRVGYAREGFRTGFSLSFRGPLQPALPQQLYVLEHPTAGRLELFLVPAAADATSRTYVATFT